MPEGAFPETNSFAMCHYGQSYEDAGELYDFVCPPMAYHLDYGKTPPAWLGMCDVEQLSLLAMTCQST